MKMQLFKIVFVNLLLLNTVFALSRLLEMACKRNPSLRFCEENPGARVVQADSPLHFRATEERLIGSREKVSLDDSFELEKVKPLPTATDFSSFDSLFADDEVPKSQKASGGEPPELPSAEDEKEKEQKHQETKEESDAQTNEYCTNFEEHFTFYCDRAISSIPKELRSFCVSYIANCPKRSQSLG
uniref:ShKT domain-containing protein n=1 Tax=Panagrellus redivivus TaxID=6233 RepID=A0A7E4ZWX3_PANRE